MATIQFYIRGKKSPAFISARLSLGRGKTYKRKTPLSIDPKKWSKAKSSPIQNDTQTKKLSNTLRLLRAYLLEHVNDSLLDNEVINGVWLDRKIHLYFNIDETESDIDYSILNNYLDYFIEIKTSDFEKDKLTLGSLKKYKVIVNRLKEYQKYARKTLRVYDINPTNIEVIEKYLLEGHKYSLNTTGRFIKFVKQIALHARDHKHVKVHKDLNMIKGYKVEAQKIYLSLEEIEKIKTTTINDKQLDEARDWLIIGCFTGQRVSDFLRFEKSNIISVDGTDLIQIRQKKTKKLTSVPIHHEVKEILNKRNGNFPDKMTDQKLNMLIKNVCELAKINQPIKGSKKQKIEGRKHPVNVPGIYPKYSLVCSHICRRSFATNFYGIIPTSLLIGITNHSSEKQFLEYVGKPEQEKSLQVAKLWQTTQENTDYKEPKKNSILKIV